MQIKEEAKAKKVVKGVFGWVPHYYMLVYHFNFTKEEESKAKWGRGVFYMYDYLRQSI